MAIGNSLTAGVSNNGLYNQSIKNAYPNLLAQQFKAAGGGNFVQALFPAGQENGTGYLKFKGYTGFIPNIVQENSQLAFTNLLPPRLSKYAGENQNLGIPSLKMADIDDPNLGQINIFYNRLLPENNLSVSYLQMVEASNPTFFTCWLGNNDVLSFASSGGKSPITDKQVFTTKLKKLLDVLTKNGAKGVIANIGDVTAAPAISLLSTYRPLLSQAKFYIQTKNGVREGTSKDFLLPPNNLTGLDLASLANKGTKISEPWLDNEVLDADEAQTALLATKEFNAIIFAEATTRKLAVMDAFSFLNKLKNDVSENGETVNATYISGGIFSLDGAHLTAKGNAFTANEYIKAMNSFYKTNLPLIDTKLYKGVVAE